VFDNIKAMAGIASVLKDMPRIKKRMEEVKQNLGTICVEADAGGGMVFVTCDGLLNVRRVRIDPRLFGPQADAAMLENLVQDATNAALTKARAAAEQELSRAAQELGLPLPTSAIGGLLS
jgi:DNA-binding YbaB/EbfC family protein